MRSLGVDVAIVEKCLDHTEENALVRVYQRSEMLPERRTAFDVLGAKLDELVPAAATAHLVVARKGVAS